MGKLVLAAKVSHVPSLMLSEASDSPLRQARADAVAALRELGRRAREREVTTFVVFDTHWLSNFGYHINANVQHRGSFTSHEAPHMIQDLRYDLPGDPALAQAIAVEAQSRGLKVLAHQVPTLGLEYGTIVPMHYLNPDGWAKVVSIASPLFTSIEESRALGEATRRAIDASDERVAILASGSLSTGYGRTRISAPMPGPPSPVSSTVRSTCGCCSSGRSGVTENSPRCSRTTRSNVTAKAAWPIP